MNYLIEYICKDMNRDTTTTCYSTTLQLGLYAITLVVEVSDNIRHRLAAVRGVFCVLVKGRDVRPLRNNVLRCERLVMGEPMALGSLPACLGSPTTGNLEDGASGLGIVLAGEVANNGSDKVGLEGVHHLLGPDGACHGSAGGRCDDVGDDTVLLALDGKRLGEADDTSLGRGVLSKIAD